MKGLTGPHRAYRDCAPAPRDSADTSRLLASPGLRVLACESWLASPGLRVLACESWLASLGPHTGSRKQSTSALLPRAIETRRDCNRLANKPPKDLSWLDRSRRCLPFRERGRARS